MLSETSRATRVAAGEPRRPAWRRSRPVWIAVAVVVVLLVLAWVVAFSPALGVRTVRVVGEQRLRPATIERAAAIAAGTPLVRVRAADIATRVEALPDVASASVSTSYPSTVVIRVTERVAVGYLAAGQGRWQLVDRTGRPFRVAATAPTALPHLVPAGGDDAATVTALAQVGGALPASVLTRLSEIRATGPARITLALRDGRSVFFGDAARVADKARVLPGLLARPGTQFDVSNPELVVAR